MKTKYFKYYNKQYFFLTSSKSSDNETRCLTSNMKISVQFWVDTGESKSLKHFGKTILLNYNFFLNFSIIFVFYKTVSIFKDKFWVLISFHINMLAKMHFSPFNAATIIFRKACNFKHLFNF